MKLNKQCVWEEDRELWEKVVISEFFGKYDIFPILYNRRVENIFCKYEKMTLTDIRYWFGYKGMELGYFKNDLLHTARLTKSGANDFILTIIRTDKNEMNLEVYKQYQKILENESENRIV